MTRLLFCPPLFGQGLFGFPLLLLESSVLPFGGFLGVHEPAAPGVHHTLIGGRDRAVVGVGELSVTMVGAATGDGAVEFLANRVGDRGLGRPVEHLELAVRGLILGVGVGLVAQSTDRRPDGLDRDGLRGVGEPGTRSAMIHRFGGRRRVRPEDHPGREQRHQRQTQRSDAVTRDLQQGCDAIGVIVGDDGIGLDGSGVWVGSRAVLSARGCRATSGRSRRGGAAGCRGRGEALGRGRRGMGRTEPGDLVPAQGPVGVQGDRLPERTRSAHHVLVQKNSLT